MKPTLLCALCLLLMTLNNPAASFYETEVIDSDGKTVQLSDYKGKVVLIVNVASKCGFTKQYTGLEALYREKKDQGFVILGFPSNEFKGQEPGTQEEILEFCRSKYDVTFPIFQKTLVKKGEGQAPLYQFLTAEHSEPKWNFYKYLVGKDGQILGEFPSKVAPESPELREAIDKALN